MEKAKRDAEEAAEIERRRLKEKAQKRKEEIEQQKLNQEFDNYRLPLIRSLEERINLFKYRFSQLPPHRKQFQRGPMANVMRKIETSLSKAKNTYGKYTLEKEMAEVEKGLNDFRRILELEEKQVKADLKEFQEKSFDRIKAVEDEYEKALSKWNKSLPKGKYDETPFSEVRTHLEKCRNCPNSSALDREISLTMKLIEELEDHTKYYIDYHTENEYGAERKVRAARIAAEKKVKEEAEKKSQRKG